MYFVIFTHGKTIHIWYNIYVGGDVMPLTDAKRRANNKYIAANMTVLGCKVRKDKAEQFKAACKAAGTTPNAVFTAAMDRFMEGGEQHE